MDLDFDEDDWASDDEVEMVEEVRVLSDLEREIAAGIVENCKVFLRKAAEEIVTHDDHTDQPFSDAVVVVVIVMLQTAIELATVALLIRKDGIGAILVAPRPSDENLNRQWQEGSLRTKLFSKLRPRAEELAGSADFWGLVETFQKARNKFVHFHQPAAYYVPYDLKFESTYLLLHLLSELLGADELDIDYDMKAVVGEDTFKRLIAFPPYQHGARAIAQNYADAVIRCLDCEADTFATGVGKCFACGWQHDLAMLNCPACEARRTVYYDELNLPLNNMLRAQCGACSERPYARRCIPCDADYAFLPWAMECPTCDPA
jgi:hypothetical protein